MTMANVHGEPHLLKQIRALAEERLDLLRTSGANFGLGQKEHDRLKSIEHELDETYKLLRESRAERDRQRFSR
jgi:hypothetical protein